MRSPEVIFVVGNSRSGTSVMAQILGKNNRVFSFKHELHFFDQLINMSKLFDLLSEKEAVNLYASLITRARKGFFETEYLRSGDLPKIYLEEAKKRLEVLLKRQIKISPASIYRDFIFYEASLHGKVIPCEQTPAYFNYIDQILKIFPNAKFIYMVRDPRDIMLSQKKRWRQAFIYENIPFRESIRTFLNYNPILISFLWKNGMKVFEERKEKYVANILIIKFEELILEPEKILKEICKYLCIDFDSKMLLVPIIGSSFSSSTKLGIERQSVFRWLKGGLNNTEIWISQKINSEYIKKFNYTFASVSPSIFLLIWYILQLPLKVLFAILFNKSRLKFFISLLIKFKDNKPN